MHKSLRLINTEEILDPYICFRKRILKSSKKSRRSESNINERIKRIWSEFNILKKVYELHLERVQLEEELLDVTMEIFNIGMESESLRKRVAKKFTKKKRDLKVEFYKSCGPFSELRKNGFKIRILKDLISKKDPNVSQAELEREVKAYENYKDLHEEPE